MFIYLFLLIFCIIQNASPIPNYKDVQLRNNKPHGIGINEPPRNLKEDTTDISTDSRRFFNWVKNKHDKGIQLRNNKIINGNRNLKEDSTDLSTESRRFFNWVKNKHDKDIQLRNNKIINGNRNLKEDSTDLSTESRRFFNWVKNKHDKDIQLRNNKIINGNRNLKEDSTDLSSESRRFFNLIKNKLDKDIQLRNNKINGNQINGKQPRNLTEDSTDLSSESRRFFNWIKNKHDKGIQLKNKKINGNQINEKPPRNLKEDSTDLSSESRRFFNLIKNKLDKEIQLGNTNLDDVELHEEPAENLFKEDSTDLSIDSRRFFNLIKNKLDKETRLGNTNLDDVELHEEPAENLFKENSSELSNESRRYFDGVKRTLRKKDSKRKTSHKQVSEESLRFKQIEANLTNTLTKLSHVLKEILNIVKHVSHVHFHNFGESSTTKSRNKRDVRFARDLNRDDIVPTKVILSNVQESINNKGVNDSIEISPKIDRSVIMNQENETEINLSKSGNVEHRKEENKNLSITKIPLEVSSSSLAMQLVNDSKEVTTKVEGQKLNKANNQSETIQEKRLKRHAADLKKTVTEKREKLEVEKVAVKRNGTEKNEVTDDAEISKTGRRSMLPTQATHDELKNRLFKYIDEAFTEIVNKIDYLKQFKQMFLNDVHYKIGYIISNIDTLEVNMRNMKRDMERNKYIWDDRKILNLYDTVKVSNQAIADLLEILKSYVEKSLI